MRIHMHTHTYIYILHIHIHIRLDIDMDMDIDITIYTHAHHKYIIYTSYIHEVARGEDHEMRTGKRNVAETCSADLR